MVTNESPHHLAAAVGFFALALLAYLFTAMIRPEKFQPGTLMHANDWRQLALFLGILAAITKPLGIYLTKVLDLPGGALCWTPVLRSIKRLTYRVMGVEAPKEHDRKGYTFALLLFSLRG